MTVDASKQGGLLSLLSWISPAFPTGSYAYSHGLEWAIEHGDVNDTASLCAWLTALLQHGSLKNDLIFQKIAWEDAHSESKIADIAAYALACASSRERYEETLWQGEAFLRAAAVWQPESAVLRQSFPCPLPVAQGAVFARGGIECDVALQAGAYSAVAALVTAAIKLVPLGQTDGLNVLRYMEAVMHRAALCTQKSTLEDVGSACFNADLVAMHHETQRTRLFRT